MQAQQQLQDVGFEREDAMAAVEKLHSVINMVQAEMAEAQEAADRLVIAACIIIGCDSHIPLSSLRVGSCHAELHITLISVS